MKKLLLLLLLWLVWGGVWGQNTPENNLTLDKLYKQFDEAYEKRQYIESEKLYNQMKPLVKSKEDTIYFAVATYIQMTNYLVIEQVEKAKLMFDEEIKTNFVKNAFRDNPLGYSVLLQRFCILFNHEKYRNTKDDNRVVWYAEITKIWENGVKNDPKQYALPHYAVVIAAQADFNRHTQRYKEAKEGYKKASSILLDILSQDVWIGKPPYHPLISTYSNIIINHNELLLQQYEYGTVEKNLLELKKILEQRELYKHYAYCLSMLGKTYLFANQVDKAEKYIKNALDRKDISEELKADTNAILAKLYMAKGNCLGAMASYEIADFNFYETGVIDIVYNRIEWAESLIKCSQDYKEAKEKLDMPFSKAFEKSFDSLSIYYIKGIKLLGDIAMAEKEYKDAEQYYQKARRLSAKGEVNALHENNFMLDISMGILKLQNKDFPQALYFVGEANNKVAKTIKNNFIYMSAKERQILLSKSTYLNCLNLETQFLNKIGDFTKQEQYQSFLQTAFNRKIELRGLLLNENIRLRSQIKNSKDTLLNKKYAEWMEYNNFVAKTLLSQQSNLPTMRKTDQSEATTDEIGIEREVRYKDSLAQVLEKELNYWANNGKKSLATPTYLEISNKLQATEAVVVIAKGDFSFENDSTITYTALVIGKNSNIMVCNLGKLKGKEQENKYLELYNKVIADNLKDKKLYKILWQPLSEKLSSLGIKKIYLCPDGIYNQINVATLYNPATKKYVEDELEITLITNPKDITEWQGESQPLRAKNAVLFGNPKYEMGKTDYEKWQPNQSEPSSDPDETGIFRGDGLLTKGFPSLQNTDFEIRQIKEFLEAQKIQTTAYLETAASKLQVQQVKNPHILHIATHGYWSTDSNTNPMLRSNLVFAGVNNYYKQPEISKSKADNGLLSAQEVATLDLDSTQLVVLSACETGLGQVVSGEGVYGLQRAFKVAGAKTILMSLWRVNDAATKEFMTIFYQHLVAGKTKHEAFRLAKKEMRAKPNYANQPAVWGAFVLVGE